MDCVVNVKSAACFFRLRLRQNAKRNPALDMRHEKRERCCIKHETNPELRRGVDRMRQRKSKRILTLLVALAVMLSLCTTAYAETESSAPAEPTASEQATETTGTAEPSAEASPSAAESAEPTETPEPSQPAQSEAPSESAEQEITDEPAVADLSSVNSVSEVAALSDTEGAEGTDGLIINKTASYNNDGSYTITLEQYVTGSVTTETKPVPADIVLVLDVSGSMDNALSGYVYTEVYSGNLDWWRTYYIEDGNGGYTQVKYEEGNYWSDGYWYYGSGNNRTTVTPKTSASDSDSSHVQFYKYGRQTKLDALKSAVNKFIDSVAENATENGVDHRIAIVTYASSASTRKSLTSVKDSAANVTSLKNTVSGLSADGSTAADYGMNAAQTVLNNADENSTKVVVMFTDGDPNHYNGFDENVANDTISIAKNIKTNGATVYTIGMRDGADDTFPVANYNSLENFNKYMHCVSSNYPNASELDDPGTPASLESGKSFYLAASSASDLNNIFQTISESVDNPSLSLGAKTVVKDTVTQYFNMPAKSAVSVYTADCIGKDSNGNYTFDDANREAFNANVTISGNTINVTNFDYATNYVNSGADGETYSGKKLIVEFTITPKDGFLGGNNVPTNGDDSGIYANSTTDTAIKNYTIPTVNVPVKDMTVDVLNKNVYLYGDVTQEDMLKDATVKVQDTYEKDIELNLSDGVANLGLETWQNEFVTITVTELQGQTDLTDDSTFTLSASMAPKAAATTEIGPKNTETKTDSDNANIFVFKPVLTFKDGEVDYLDDAPTNYNVYKVGETVWKHGTASSTDEGVKILGGKPTLDLTYTPGDGITDRVITSKDTDIPVQVTVKINEKNATEYTKFEHQACDPACVWSNDKEDGNPAFLLHPKNTVLTIAKTVSGGEANPNDHFEFTITGGEALKGRTVNAAITGADGCSEGHNHGINNAKLSFDENGKATVYLKHGEKITIEGLKAGEVTIAEDNGDYTLTAEVNGTEAEVNNSSIDATLSRGETTEAELNNELGGNPITGIDSDNAPFIIIGAAVVICAAGFVFLRRRRGRSDF